MRLLKLGNGSLAAGESFGDAMFECKGVVIALPLIPNAPVDPDMVVGK